MAEGGGRIVSHELVAQPQWISVRAIACSKLSNSPSLKFGGIDSVVNTAAIYPVPGADGELTEAQWAKTFLVNVTGNYLLARANRVGI